jgi:bifunctional DNA-binding transcriptional regulator/antitoxin component of YhaV-PrlF toxin-antitoxin module
MSPDRRMVELTKGIASKSDKMRALHAAGYERSAIAKFLDVRYQFVRNVLVQDEARDAERKSTAEATDSPELEPVKLRLGPDGRVLIPATFRDALKLGEGTTLIGSIVDGELHLLTVEAAMRKAQAIVKRFVPAGVSLVDELIDDRRREADRER